MEGKNDFSYPFSHLSYKKIIFRVGGVIQQRMYIANAVHGVNQPIPRKLEVPMQILPKKKLAHIHPSSS